MLLKLRNGILIFLLLSSSIVSAEGKADYFFERGKNKCDKGNYLAGILEYREALLRNPDHVATHINIGVAYLQNGFLNDMIDELEEGQWDFSDLPEYAFALNSLAVVSRERMKVKKECPPCVKGIEKVIKDSVYHLEKAKKLSPDLHQPYYNLGIIYHRQKKYKKALYNLLKVKNKYKQDRSYFYHLTCTYLMLEKEKQAIFSLERAIENGFKDKFLLEINSNFENIRGNPKFIRLLSKISENAL